MTHPTLSPGELRRVVLAAAVGNIIEWYDFGCGYEIVDGSVDLVVGQHDSGQVQGESQEPSRGTALGRSIHNLPSTTYDFYIFGSLATALSVRFFEKSNPVAALLSTWRCSRSVS